MRTSLAAALPLLAACATLPPLRPADPAQAVANERSSAAAAAGGVRVVVRPGAPSGYGADLQDFLTPIDVTIENGSGREIDVRSTGFSLLAAGGLRYAALTPDEVRHAVGPYRGGAWGGHAYALRPGYAWAPYYPSRGWWAWSPGPGPWWNPVVHYGGAVPPRALTRGTLAPGGRTTLLLLFPVPFTSLSALTLDVNLADASGLGVAALRVPFVREGKRPAATPLPPIAAPPADAPAQPGAAPPQPPDAWETLPPQVPRYQIR
ncbi:MAG TPA: hypothetical protein VFL83_20640 [Anaeromyxobacter sp.]|nr:hypothetical protein [Anaeromyxobacter sp.]